MTFCSFSLLTSSCSEKKQVSKVKWPQRPATPVQSQSKNKTFLAFFLTSDAGSLRSLGTKLLSSLALRALPSSASSCSSSLCFFLGSIYKTINEPQTKKALRPMLSAFLGLLVLSNRQNKRLAASVSGHGRANVANMAPCLYLSSFSSCGLATAAKPNQNCHPSLRVCPLLQAYTIKVLDKNVEALLAGLRINCLASHRQACKN